LNERRVKNEEKMKSFMEKWKTFIEKWKKDEVKKGHGKIININDFPESSLSFASWESYQNNIKKLKEEYWKNPNKFRKKTRDFNKKHPEKKKGWDKKYREAHKEDSRFYHKKWRNKNVDYLKEHKRLSYLQIKKSNPQMLKRWVEKADARYKDNKFIVLLHYSPKGSRKPTCCCCRETNIFMLTIDHKNGRGTKHRQKWGTNIYRWLKRNDYPKGHQTMCFNCNVGRAFAGTKLCPHNFELKITKSNE